MLFLFVCFLRKKKIICYKDADIYGGKFEK